MPIKPTASKLAAAKKAAAKTGKPTAAPAKKLAAKGAKSKTSIIVKVDVGWGNSVYIRGEGGGLSWDVGVLMDCDKKDEWVWCCPASDGPIIFKLIRNDLHWSLDKDQIAKAGQTTIVVPKFPPWQ
jgi:hypothetical protein